jgi:hypothetical protein
LSDRSKQCRVSNRGMEASKRGVEASKKGPSTQARFIEEASTAVKSIKEAPLFSQSNWRDQSPLGLVALAHQSNH